MRKLRSNKTLTTLLIMLLIITVCTMGCGSKKKTEKTTEEIEESTSVGKEELTEAPEYELDKGSDKYKHEFEYSNLEKGKTYVVTEYVSMAAEGLTMPLAKTVTKFKPKKSDGKIAVNLPSQISEGHYSVQTIITEDGKTEHLKITNLVDEYKSDDEKVLITFQ